MSDKIFSVRWLRLSLWDLRKISQYIAQDDPTKAAEIAQMIWDSGQSLRTFPERGRFGGLSGTRELVLPTLPHLIAYRFKDSTVQILRVIHTSRQWPPAEE